jgi:hypothetical protein
MTVFLHNHGYVFDFISFNILELQKKSNPFLPYILSHTLSQIHHITTQYQFLCILFHASQIFLKQIVSLFLCYLSFPKIS